MILKNSFFKKLVLISLKYNLYFINTFKITLKIKYFEKNILQKTAIFIYEKVWQQIGRKLWYYMLILHK